MRPSTTVFLGKHNKNQDESPNTPEPSIKRNEDIVSVVSVLLEKEVVPGQNDDARDFDLIVLLSLMLFPVF